MNKIIYDELDYENYNEQCLIFDELFDNKNENKTYVITGDIGLWDGVRKGVHHPSFFNSLKDVILTCNDGFYGYISVSEKSYGKMTVHICHHDGNNYLEIKELTKIGLEMKDNYKSVKEILKRKGATKNVNYIKNYR